MNESLVASAQKLFQPLSDAETRMLDGAINGKPAICGDKYDDTDPANAPSGSDTWPPSRTIRADIIYWLCTSNDAPGRVDKRGIHIYAAKISGFLNFPCATIPFPLIFVRCAFAEDISFKNARIPSLTLTSSWTHTILADGVDVANNVLLNEGFYSRGEVLFRDAKIGGNLRTDGAVFEYVAGGTFGTSSENALGCDRIKVNGSVFLSRRDSQSRFCGEVAFAGAWIGSNLECDGGTFDNPGKAAIRADRVAISGSVFLRDGFSSTGEVRLPNSKIGNILDCTNGTFSNPGGIALIVEGGRVESHAMFRGNFTCNGHMALRGMHVGDSMDCQLGKFTTLDLRYATIHRNFRWKGIRDPQNTAITLQDAFIGSIEDDQQSWPSPGKFHASGLKYESFVNCPTDVSTRVRWVRLDKSDPPQMYRQLAHFYTEMGETKRAREVLYFLEDLLHSRRSSAILVKVPNPFPALWSFLLKWTIGYGYKLWRAAVWMLLLTIIGFTLSSIGYREKMIVPTDKDALTYFDKHGQPPDFYPRFSSFMYSVEHSVPAINLGVSNSWSANTAAEVPGLPRYLYRLRWWFCAQTLLGWVLSIFFIGGITGLVKSDK